MSLIRRLWKSRHGATAIEYSLIASLLSVAIIGSAASVGVDLMGLYDAVSDKVAAAITDK
jgi:pilus assembly protein Flp/PilA